MGTCTVECWGCRKSETHPILHGEEYEALMTDMAARGWRRRAFWPANWDKGPWFCSEDCATNSYNAKQAEEWWAKKEEEERQKEFEKYCKEEADSWTPLFAILTFLTVMVLAVAIGDCVHARLQ